MAIKGSGNRIKRVADQVQRAVAQVLQNDIDDQRLKMITVNEVVMSADAKHANIFVTFMYAGNAEESAPLLKILNGNAADFIRCRLSQVLYLRYTPVLRFHYDSSFDQGRKVNALIDRALEVDNALVTD